MARSRSPRKKRPEMTRAAAREAGGFFAVVSLLAAIGVWWLGAVFSHHRSELAAYKAAPVCAAGAAGTTCRTVLDAVVQDSAFHGGKGSYTRLVLAPTGGGSVTAQVSGERSLPIGEAVTVTLWRGQAALIQPGTDGAAAIVTESSPQWNVPNDATGVLLLMAFVLGGGTGAWGFFTYFTVSRRRAAPVHGVAFAMFVAVAVLRIGNDYEGLEVVAFAGPPVFLALTLLWLPSARRASAS